MYDIVIKGGNILTPFEFIKNGVIAIEDGRISYVGEEDKPARKVLLARNKVVIPAFCDPHTHLVFAGDRADEFEMRLKGVPYMEIAKRGGGIMSTVRKVRETSEEDLFLMALKRLDYALYHGTATIEIKSGYGLNLEEELKILRVIKRLKDNHRIRIVSTFLGAHFVPPEFEYSEYVDYVIDMIPEVKDLCDFCDVFCEEGAFTPSDSERILEAGKKYGLMPKIHADEIKSSGGSEVAGKVGAVSADHLVYPSDNGLKLMAQAGTVAVLLPGTSLFLMEKETPPVEKMRSLKIPVAIGTDFNPGSSPILNMQLIVSLACLKYKLTPQEAIISATYNAAKALNLENETGSIEEGKSADILIMKVENYKEIPYWIGFDLIEKVIVKGEICR